MSYRYSDLQFKDPHLKDELDDPAKTNPMLRSMLYEIGYFCQVNFYPLPVITRVWWHEGQPAAENSGHRIRPDNPFCSAIDFRGWLGYYTEEQEANLVGLGNRFWKRSDGFKTVMIHGEGDQRHFHVQVQQIQV